MWSLSIARLHECMSLALDASSCVLFAVSNHGHAVCAEPMSGLLDLHAGAGPKRGKLRAFAKPEKLCKNKICALWKKTAYVRHGATRHTKRNRAKWSMNLNTLNQLNEKQLIERLTRAGFLKDWTTCLCPNCGKDGVDKLQKYKGRASYVYRCTRKGCQRFILPHEQHPVFTQGWGRDHKTLKHQTQLLLGLIVGLTGTQAHLLWDDNAKYVQRFSNRLDAARAKYVRKFEKKIKFGTPTENVWQDVEADEVDLFKEEISTGPRSSRARWHQWAGIVQRGCPSSLVLFQTTPKLTKFNSPGPGPISKKDWTPIAEKWLKNRCVFLHTDGARSYKLGLNRKRKLNGVVHDYVVHKKKKVAGKWVKPRYVQLFRHRMPSGAVVCTKGGTQIIDRIWRHIGEQQKFRNPIANRRLWHNRIRASQWMYWNMDTDVWMKTGEMFKDLLHKN
jgi:hypothetical protein